MPGLVQRFLKRSSPAPAPVPSPALDQPLPDIGNRDDRLYGWRRADEGLLFHDFPIDADDFVVDVGCGDGANAEFCVKRGAHVVMVDSDPARVADAQWRIRDVPAPRYEAHVSDADPLPLASGVASRVVAVEVIEHVDDPDRFLAELMRIGRSGALYLLSVPDAACEHLLKQVAPANAYEKPNHVRIIERDAFAAMIERAGLVIESRHTGGFYHAIRSLFFWAGYVDPARNRNAVLDQWCLTWNSLLDSESGHNIRELLESVLPKSQVIVARKP